MADARKASHEMKKVQQRTLAVNDKLPQKKAQQDTLAINNVGKK